MKTLIVSLHDVHPGSLDSARNQVDFCRTLGVNRFSILAVPQFHHGKMLIDDEPSTQWLDQRAQSGDDIALHGFFHDRQDRQGGSLFYTRFYTANEAEFLDLPEDELKNRITQGRQLWDKKGWLLNGFVAPAWLMPESQDHLLIDAGFSYTTRLKTIHALNKNKKISTQSLCYSTRAAWRIAASLLWNPWLFSCLRNTPVIRLSLHPNDFNHPSVQKQIRQILELALAEGFQPLSYSEYVSTL